MRSNGNNPTRTNDTPRRGGDAQGGAGGAEVSEPLTFLASIAPLQSAITIASDGGARVKIDIPESEMPAIVRLMLMRGKVLRVTVEEEAKELDAPKVRGWRK